MTLNPGQAQTLTFTVSTHDLAYWNTGSNNWTTAAGNYQILLGDSSRNLPLTGTLNVPNTVNNAVARRPPRRPPPPRRRPPTRSPPLPRRWPCPTRTA